MGRAVVGAPGHPRAPSVAYRENEEIRASEPASTRGGNRSYAAGTDAIEELIREEEPEQYAKGAGTVQHGQESSQTAVPTVT